MEMHQIRYFLAASRLLNFTRAAEECNVAQPSLTRAVKLLEDELGGELFRRERNLTHLTELGARMLPLLQQCYDSAQSAKSIATSLKKGAVAPLSLALSRSIAMQLLIPHLGELISTFEGLELKFTRGTAAEVAAALKKGDVELAISGNLGETWERLDAWPLFTEPCGLLAAVDHALASRNQVRLEHLAAERLLDRGYCEQREQLMALMRARGFTAPASHLVASEGDLAALLSANVGVAIAPRSTALPQTARFVPIHDLALSRTVSVYAISGRQRSPAAATLLKMLRAADWSAYEV